MKKRFKAFIGTTVLLSSLSLVLGIEDQGEMVKAVENEKPDLVFPVISDVHIDNGSTADMTKFRNALDQLNSIAPKQDAFVVVGDLTDYGYESEYDKFFSVFNEKKQENTVSMFAMGNHDYWNGLSEKNAQERFLQKTGMESIYYHKEVNDYHFIVLSPEQSKTHGHYSVAQIEWLGEQLKHSAKEDPKKPIFVFLHQHIKDTVYGSDAWGTVDNKELLYETLKQYPQVVTFSGHSHYALENPRSIHQKDFTSIGTGSVSYLELESGKIQGALPPGNRNLSSGLLVEVYNNNVKIKRRDFHQNDWTGEEWIVNNPSEKSEFRYSEDRDHVFPAFRDNAIIQIPEDSITSGKMEVKFSQATDNLLVHSYNIMAKNLKTGTIDKQFNAFSEFYYDPMPDTLNFPIDGLQYNTEYEIEVQALDAFGNASKKTLKTRATTKAPVAPAATSYLSDLPWIYATNGWGPVERDMSNGSTGQGDGKIITLNGQTFQKGLGVHAHSEVQYYLGGNFKRFTSYIGIDDTQIDTSAASVTFEVWGDGKKLYDSGLMTAVSETKHVDVNVEGVKDLKLVVTNAGNGNGNDHGTWAEAKIIKE